MKVVLSHPTGNQFVRALISGLADQDLLSEFDTTIATDPNSVWIKLLPAKVRQDLLRRTYPVSANKINTFPFKEFARTVLPKIGMQSAVKHEVGWASVDAVYQDLDENVARRLINLKAAQQVDAVYAYEDGALASFTEAKRLGLSCFYDQPIGYWRSAQQLLAAEVERWPDWAATLPGVRDSAAKLARKDQELQMADKIFAASSFTAKTLKSYPGQLAPVTVVPYGFPAVGAGRHYDDISATRPLKMLFAGGLSQRKGIADVFAAAAAFGDRVELTVLGSRSVNNCAVLNEALAKHRWIPSLPHQQVLDLMRQHDVLLFPSLFEGFGLVITEAMAQGTPVITTERTAGPDIIEDGDNGWLIPAGSTEKLIEAIDRILLNPQIIEKTGRAALESAKNRPWALYGQEMVNAISV